MEGFDPMVYELTDRPEDGGLELDGLFLREAGRGSVQPESIRKEASRWRAVERVSFEKTLFWHDDDRQTGSYVTVHANPAWVVKNGSFFGLLVRFSDENGFGMSSHRSPRMALLGVDGSVRGHAERRASRSGSETETEETGVFILERTE